MPVTTERNTSVSTTLKVLGLEAVILGAYDGPWIEDGQRVESLNPSTGEPLANWSTGLSLAQGVELKVW